MQEKLPTGVKIRRRVLGGIKTQMLGLRIIVSNMFLALVAGNVWASDKCEKVIATNRNMEICGQLGLDKVDRVLNEEYKLAITALSDKNKGDLLLAQRAWLKYRDEYCSFVYDAPDHGAEAAIDKIGCLADLTSFRISELVTLRAGRVIDGFYTAANSIYLANQEIGYEGAIKLLSGGRV